MQFILGTDIFAEDGAILRELGKQMRGTNMRVIVETGPPGSGVEFSLPLHRRGGVPGQMVGAILEEMNEEEDQGGTAELTFIPTCSPLGADGSRGKENG